VTWITYLTLTCPKSLIFPKSLLNMTSQRFFFSHDVISLEYETKHTNLTLVNERQNSVTSCTNCPYLISTFIPLDVDKFGTVCFFIAFQLFVSWTVFFFKYALLVWNLTKIFFFEYRKYSIRQRWLPVIEGHLTPTSPEAFPHNASLYVIINYPDRWRYYLITW
jgi:hypothetical protein